MAAGRMRIIEGAITDSSESTVRFYVYPEAGWGTTSTEWDSLNSSAGEAKPVDVPAVNFSDTLRATGIPSLMKIDVEGADRVCLEALLNFEQRPQSLSIEANPHYTDAKGLDSGFELLQRLGYDRFAIVQQASIPGSEIATRTLDGQPLSFRFEAGASGAFGSDIGPWMDSASARARYKRLFFSSRLITPLIWRWRRHGSIGLGFLNWVAAHLPQRGGTGWYDTHAARSTAMDPPTFLN